MNAADDNAHAARQLLAGTFEAVISTHSLAHEGYPFGSVVPYVPGHDGRPLMLLSHLSQHTKNIDVDGRCGLTVIEQGGGDIQQLGRLGAIGDMQTLSAEDGDDHDGERYFDYFPQARMYFEQLGFRFYRFEPLRFHWNGGFATARWFGNDRILRPKPLDRAAERAIVSHMNHDHVDALRSYLGQPPRAMAGEPPEMIGIDGEGIDLRVDGGLQRVPLLRAIDSADDARAVLVEMAEQERG